MGANRMPSAKLTYCESDYLAFGVGLGSRLAVVSSRAKAPGEPEVPNGTAGGDGGARDEEAGKPESKRGLDVPSVGLYGLEGHDSGNQQSGRQGHLDPARDEQRGGELPAGSLVAAAVAKQPTGGRATFGGEEHGSARRPRQIFVVGVFDRVGRERLGTGRFFPPRSGTWVKRLPSARSRRLRTNATGCLQQ